jgi:outer membrane protein, heavy metal efflux system
MLRHTKRVAGWVLLVAASAYAQTSSPPLELKAALEQAQVSNLELRAARQQRAVALAGIKIAGQFANPTVSVSVARDTPHESLLWDQPIDIGKRGKRIGVAREEQKGAEIDISILERQIRHRTRDAFYLAVLARADTEQAKAALDLSTRIRDVVQARYQAGDVAQLEVIQAEVELARAATDYEVTVQSQKVADVELAVLLNRPLDRPLELSGRVEDLPDVATLPVITEMALRSNADVQRTAQQYAIEEQRLGLAKSARIPNVDVQVGVDFNSPPDFNLGPRGQIALNLPLFNHGQGEVAQSTARLDLLRLSMQAQKSVAEARVFSAYYDYEAKLRQASDYRMAIVPQTVRLEDMAEESYRAGKSNLLTLIDAQRRLNETRKAYLASVFAVQSAFSALEEVVGAPLD